MTTLGQFLRGRREQLQPADVGLAAGTRRRTPGLRREEVATLAGVSVDYLIRLEQGRDVRPSSSVVRALGSALRLNDTEMLQLWSLATISSNKEMCPSDVRVDEIAPTVQRLLDRLAPTPAYLVSSLSDVLASNAAWDRLVGGTGLDGEHLNLARFVFLDPTSRDLFMDWDVVADATVTSLRSGAMHWAGEERYTTLLAALEESPGFRSRWSSFVGTDVVRRRLRIAHPELGALRVDEEVLSLVDRHDQRLVTWLPADEATDAALSRISGERRLRSIG